MVDVSENFVVTEIKQQYKNIDVLVTVNDKYKIIIEDKTYTNVHDNQLVRYKERILDEFKKYHLACVYFKTGFEGNRDEIEKAGYQMFDLGHILNIMENFKDKTENEIFHNYLEYWSVFNKTANTFHVTNVKCWRWEQILGFYDYLYKGLSHEKLFKEAWSGGYGYVPNPSGGFYGMWLIPKISIPYQGIEFYPYLQMEFYPSQDEKLDSHLDLCLKLAVKSNAVEDFDTRVLRNIICYEKKAYCLEMLGFSKPKRLSSGKYMTIGKFGAVNKEYSSVYDILTSLDEILSNFDDIIFYCQKKVCHN